MAELSWFYWLSFDGLAAADRVSTPSLFVHSDGCVFPDHVRAIHESVRGPKRLVGPKARRLTSTISPGPVATAAGAARAWFDETLAR